MLAEIQTAAQVIAIACAALAFLAGSPLLALRVWWEWLRPLRERRVMRQLDAAPVTVIRLPPLPVPHVEATETAPPVGAIGTMAPDVSDDLEWWLTAQEQSVAACWDVAHADHDLWLLGQAVDRALADYETAMLTRRSWIGILDYEEIDGVAVESTQQRIDRWLREGGALSTVVLADVRRAASETWDAPSAELPIVERPDAERVVEAVLAS